MYILHSHVIAYVPSAAIKEILTRSDPDGRREKWIVVLLEYDLEIKLTKIIKGQGLAKLMTQSNYEALDINMMGIGSEIDSSSTVIFSQPEVFLDLLASVWYKNIIYVLQNLQALEGLSKTQARCLKLKAALTGIYTRKTLEEFYLVVYLKMKLKKRLWNFIKGIVGVTYTRKIQPTRF